MEEFLRMKLPANFVKKVIDNLYGYCTVAHIFDSNGRLVAEVPIDTNEPSQFVLPGLQENGYVLIDLKKDIRTCKTITSLTSTFWTCNCQDHFVKHIADSKCSECGTQMSNSTQRLEYFKLKKGFDYGYDFIQ